ncbi:hypothetical protein BDR03DRAFT_974906 [Suillus americanus]|nr:hypothetical protein BDR03DRAFT_974906 [Suillus americanus]
MLRSLPSSILYSSTLKIPLIPAVLLFSHFPHHTHTPLHLFILRAYLAITCTLSPASLAASSSACASFVVVDFMFADFRLVFYPRYRCSYMV